METCPNKNIYKCKSSRIPPSVCRIVQKQASFPELPSPSHSYISRFQVDPMSEASDIPRGVWVQRRRERKGGYGCLCMDISIKIFLFMLIILHMSTTLTWKNIPIMHNDCRVLSGLLPISTCSSPIYFPSSNYCHQFLGSLPDYCLQKHQSVIRVSMHRSMTYSS